MSSSEKFCLRWNDFESNISVAFRELREEKDFFDVTLACDDSQIQAHKVILSACSPFFRNVLRRNPHQHPLLYLKGVKYQELLSVLNFMYMGEVNVAQEELNSFLAVAEDLRVKGLTQNNSGSSSTKQEPPKPSQRVNREPPDREQSQPVPKRQRPAVPPPAPRPSYSGGAESSHHSQSHDADDDIQEVVPVKSEPREQVVVAQEQQQVVDDSYQDQQVVARGGQQQQQQQHTNEGALALDTAEQYDESYDYGQYGDGSYDDGGAGVIDPNTGLPMQQGDGSKGQGQYEIFQHLDQIIQSKTYRSEGISICSECGFQTKHMTNMKNHIETKHISELQLKIPCLYCETVVSTRCALRMHVKRQHQC